jgi:hypothetical protein
MVKTNLIIGYWETGDIKLSCFPSIVIHPNIYDSLMADLNLLVLEQVDNRIESKIHEIFNRNMAIANDSGHIYYYEGINPESKFFDGWYRFY